MNKTDIQRTKDFLDSLDIDYEEESANGGTLITMEAGTHKNVGGYDLFACTFCFDGEGAFRKVEIAE